MATKIKTTKAKKTKTPKPEPMWEDGLEKIGFEMGEFGTMHADGCKITLYRVMGAWEIDITLPDGGCIAMDVPVAAVQGRTAEQVAASRKEHYEMLVRVEAREEAGEFNE